MFNIDNVKIDGYAGLAPMAGVADRAFRQLCKSYGASYVVSEMVSAKGISYKNEKTQDLMLLSDEERPAALQLFGSEPKIVAQAAKESIKYNPDILDINMGCPAPKITNNGCGSALMKNPKLCGEIVKAVKSLVEVPITVKIRKGFNDENINALEVAKYCQEAGASAITVHGRTREQFYSGVVDLEIIKQVKENMDIPVIGNGDITSGQKAIEMYNYTKCDYVLVGRGALGNPYIFTQINSFIEDGVILKEPTIEEKMETMLTHILLIEKYKGEKHGVREARKHIAWYLKGFKNAASYRNAVGKVDTIEDVEKLIKLICTIDK